MEKAKKRKVCMCHTLYADSLYHPSLSSSHTLSSLSTPPLPPNEKKEDQKKEDRQHVVSTLFHVIYPLLTIMLLTKCCYSFLTCCNKITNVEAHQEKVSIFHCHILSSANLMIVLDSQNNIYYIPHHATHTPRRGVQVEAVPM